MIIIPMAGLSRRFSDAGYIVPKYMLPLHGKSVFAHAISSFCAYFESEKFVFVARDVLGTGDFVAAECRALGIKDFTVVILNHETEGQAETVELGLQGVPAHENQPLAIFNIDTFRQNFGFPDAAWFEKSDGYLEVFRGSGANWSYVGPMPQVAEPVAARTTEKQPISDLCCNGLYYFARAADFKDALAAERAKPSSPELYVAPLYNHLISAGKRIHYQIVAPETIAFCGVPAEYELLRNGRAADMFTQAR